MNRALVRLYIALAALFLGILAMTGYWQLWAAPSLAARLDNQRQIVRELSIRRGDIVSSDGKILATNRLTRTRDGREIYLRRYPQGKLFAAVVGYSSAANGRTGIERSANDYLTGANTDLTGTLQRELHSLSGGLISGNTVETSIRSDTQKAAAEALAKTGRPGAAFAYEPKTGRVFAMVSAPSYDPNRAVAGKLPKTGSALLNRATQGRYPPGSAFKVVTAAAALASGKYTKDSRFFNRGYFEFQGRKILNASSGERPGWNTLTESLTYSLNSTFAEIGAKLCPRSSCPLLTSQMQSLGFFSVPPLDFPGDQIQPSGLLSPRTQRIGSPAMEFDPARSAIGQANVVATPLQMAMVAGTLANHGVEMRPTLIDRVRTRAGKTITTTKPRVLNRAFSPSVADEVATMMRSVVNVGTGQAAQIPGVAIAGKTGTAQTGKPGVYDAWFIGFAPADNPQVAVAVVIENTQEYGGIIAAPVAKAMMQSVVGSG